MRLLGKLRSTLGLRVGPVLCVMGLALTGAGCGDSGDDDGDGGTTVPSNEPNWDPTAPQLDLSCLDGKYEEVIPTDLPDLTETIAGFSSANYREFIDDILAQTYPFGAYLVEEGVRLGARMGDCVADYVPNRSSANRVIRQLSTVVHECGHYLDLSIGQGGAHSYVVSESLTFQCSRGDTTSRGGDTFARSRINNDKYSALKPDDFYKDTYLNGNPDDRVFESGDQGFNMLLEETMQYVHSLATDYYLRNQFGATSVSSRDGILTFLWYVQRYLQMARLEYPDAYTRLTTDSCWREAILTTWGRAWRYLEASDPSLPYGNNLGIETSS